MQKKLEVLNTRLDDVRAGSCKMAVRCAEQKLQRERGSKTQHNFGRL